MPKASKPVKYLSLSEVAGLLGVEPTSMARYQLPEPEVIVGRSRGWSEATIKAWMAQRPGSGRWGPRD